jgi:hypothetical protein
VILPETIAPLAGEERDTSGGVVSGIEAKVVAETRLEKAEAVTRPVLVALTLK